MTGLDRSTAPRGPSLPFQRGPVRIVAQPTPPPFTAAIGPLIPQSGVRAGLGRWQGTETAP